MAQNGVPENIQEDEYTFPYHYIPQLLSGKFSQLKVLGWGYLYMSRLQRVIELLGTLEFNSLLDVGCGDGRFLHELHQVVPQKHLVGVDYTITPIHFAQAFNPELEFRQLDISAQNLHFTEKFDVITLIEVIEHIPPEKLESFIKGVSSHLKESGKLIITTPMDNIPTSKKHYQHFNLQKLETLLGDSYTFTLVEYCQKPISGLDKLTLKFLSNRFFMVTNEPFVSTFYRKYVTKYFHADKSNSTDILVVCTKKA